MDLYKIQLDYYEAGVLIESYDTQRMIANEDSAEFTIGRNDQFEGVFQEISDTFIFIKEDRDWIIEKRNLYLDRLDRDTKLVMMFSELNTTTLEYDLLYTGRALFFDMEVQPYYVEVQLSEDDIITKLSAIQEDEYTVEDNGKQYGYTLSQNAVKDATKVMRYSGVYRIYESELDTEYLEKTVDYSDRKNENDTDLDDYYSDGEDGLTVYLPEEIESVVVEPCNINAYLDVETYSAGGGTDPIVADFTVELELRVEIDYKDGGDLSEYQIGRSSNTVTAMGADTLEDQLTSIRRTITFDDSRLVFDADDPTLCSSIRIYAWYAISVDSATLQSYDSTINVLGTENADSMGVSMRLTGTKTSSILGQSFGTVIDKFQDLIGININTDYLDTTIYSDMIMSTARGITGTSPINFNMSFDDLFDSMKSFMALSLSAGDDGNTVYIKSIEDAYDTEVVDLGEVLSLDIDMNDKVFNKLTIGNSGGTSSNFENGDLDYSDQAVYSFGLDEGNEVTHSNSIRVDASTINKAAIDFENIIDSEEDRDDDKDIYLINDNPSTDNLTSRFTLLDGVDVDKFGKAINMEFSRSRTLYNWRNYYGHMFTGVSSLNLLSWSKNAELEYTDSERLVDVVDTPEAVTDIDDITPIFGKNQYSIEIANAGGVYRLIKENKNKVFGVQFEGNDYYGYLSEASISVLAKGTVSLTLIQAA